MKKTVIASLVVVMVLSLVVAFAGMGAPSGPHYNLNLIGVPQDKDAVIDSGNRIFVLLGANCKIMLTEGDFAVLDGNGTDGYASFRLPSPDPTNSGTTEYSVFARVVGKPTDAIGTIRTEADKLTGEHIVSVDVLSLQRTKQPKFENVSRQLLYIWADIDGDGDIDRVPLFDSRLQNYLWNYDNNGLKVVQLRFYYDVSTIVPADPEPVV